MLMISCFPGNQQVETDSGSLIPEVNGILQYRIAKDAIGKFISFQCTPVRDDGIVGEPRTCMSQERVRPGNFVLLCHNICCGDYCLYLFLLSGKHTLYVDLLLVSIECVQMPYNFRCGNVQTMINSSACLFIYFVVKSFL